MLKSLALVSQLLPSRAPRLATTGGQIPFRTRTVSQAVTGTRSRRYGNMAQVSPFTRTVVASMRQLYPEPLADKSFDNTGLLLEAPIPSHLPRRANSVLLTIDLTKAVADEAIRENHSVVVAYHPIIFRGLKALTMDDSQQETLLRLASHGISVYSPHTAVDIVPDGMADWLCDIVTGKIEPGPEPRAVTSDETLRQGVQEASAQASEPVSETDVTTSEDEGPVTPDYGSSDPFFDNPATPKPEHKRLHSVHRTYSKPSYPSRVSGRSGNAEKSPQSTLSPMQTFSTTTFHPSVIRHSRSIITPSPSSAIDAANRTHSQSTSEPPYTSENTGAGRLVTFEQPQPLSALITRIAHATGTPKGFPVAIPQSASLESIRIKTVGICPGSGSGVMRGCREPPDLVFTGEMSHHEALAVIERGGCVVTLFHSNSERGYLDAVMREKLEIELQNKWADSRKAEQPTQDGGVKEILNDASASVVVSRRDRDPFGIVVLQESAVQGEKVG